MEGRQGKVHVTQLQTIRTPGHLQRRDAWSLEESGKDLIFFKNDKGNQLEANKNPSDSENLA